MSELRLYAVISMDAMKASNGARGKMMAQAGHAFLHAYWDAEQRFPSDAGHYRFGCASATKIVLAAPNAEALRAIYDLAHPHYGTSLVTDAARTVFSEPTVTALGVGPIDLEMQAPEWLRELKPLQ